MLITTHEGKTKDVPSLDARISHVSPSTARSRQMRWNSDDGILMTHEYSSSGMFRASASRSISFISNWNNNQQTNKQREGERG